MSEDNAGGITPENQPAPQDGGAGGDAGGDVLLGGGSEGGDPGAAAKSTDGKVADTGAPEAYADFTFPEGLTLDAAKLDELKAHYKELGLTQDQAQKAAVKEANAIKQGLEAQTNAVTQLREGWLNAVRSDAEIGGDGFEQNLAAAKLGLSKFGTPELNTLLRTSGLGNHPEVIRVFTRIGKTLKEDQPTPGGGGVAPQQKDLATRMYSTTAN